MTTLDLTDPRLAQVAALAGLLAIGTTMLDFSISPTIAFGLIGTSLVFERIATRDAFDPLSPLITALSLCLLLRTQSFALAIGCAGVAILSKRLIRCNGKHVFNPSAFALVVITASFDLAWISPGQWGTSAYLLILLAGTGALVSNRANRFDLSLAFLGAYAAIALCRAWYLGDPLTIPLHHLSNGALLIFAFFMISDPRTSPSSCAGRMAFAIIVALGAATMEFLLFRPSGPLYALVLSAPLVPLIDKLFPGSRYTWTSRGVTTTTQTETRGAQHA